MTLETSLTAKIIDGDKRTRFYQEFYISNHFTMRPKADNGDSFSFEVVTRCHKYSVSFLRDKTKYMWTEYAYTNKYGSNSSNEHCSGSYILRISSIRMIFW